MPTAVRVESLEELSGRCSKQLPNLCVHITPEFFWQNFHAPYLLAVCGKCLHRALAPGQSPAQHCPDVEEHKEKVLEGQRHVTHWDPASKALCEVGQ